jgi:hypothetical protein
MRQDARVGPNHRLDLLRRHARHGFHKPAQKACERQFFGPFTLDHFARKLILRGSPGVETNPSVEEGRSVNPPRGHQKLSVAPSLKITMVFWSNSASF